MSVSPRVSRTQHSSETVAAIALCVRPYHYFDVDISFNHKLDSEGPLRCHVRMSRRKKLLLGDWMILHSSTYATLRTSNVYELNDFRSLLPSM